MREKKIGVLAVQGAVSEHIDKLKEIEGVTACVVKYAFELDDLDGLIIPGGESTAIGRILRDFSLIEPIQRRYQEGMAVWGTCAGMILLAKELADDDVKHLCLMDICVRRNAYGRQLDSFITEEQIPQVSQSPIPLVFIRAPYVEAVLSSEVEVLLTVNGHIVACRQGMLLATSFHPELTDDGAFHKYFVHKVCREA